MKIGIIGAGRVGGALGKAWSAAGHDVMFGMRDPGRAGEKDIPGSAGTIEEAAHHGEVVAFAIPGVDMIETVRDLNLAGKTVIDASNRGGTPEKPVCDAIAELQPEAQVYKAFNTLGFENTQNPHFGEERADMLFIGPEAGQERVAGLIGEVGYNPVYVGDLDQWPVLDSALTFWFNLQKQFGRHTALRILRD